MKKTVLIIAPLDFGYRHSPRGNHGRPTMSNGTFTNPLMYDEFSDPDILRGAMTTTFVGTTMHTVPGLVILHSR